MKPLLIDGILHNDSLWFGLPDAERTWRSIACQSNAAREQFVHPDVVKTMGASTSDHVYGYRYLEPEHLLPPWTPGRLLVIDGVSHVASHYKSWADSGERIYEEAIQVFEEAGLPDYVEWVRAEREKFRKLTAWLTCDHTGWKPFQVDINWPSLFLNVTGPDVWQSIVDTLVADGSHDKDFVAHMKMASIDYVVKKIPGPHGNPYRKHDPESPLGYGVSTRMPSFGYRREHRSDTLFTGWAAAVMPQWDLLGDRFWPTQEAL